MFHNLDFFTKMGTNQFILNKIFWLKLKFKNLQKMRRLRITTDTECQTTRIGEIL